MKRNGIKPKEGACEVEGCTYEGVLIAKKCKTHYWKHRASVKKKSPSKSLKSSENKNNRRELEDWFERQIKNIPTHCEECGVNLGGWRQYAPRTIIAHILPKRASFGGFPKVATHEENRMFYCPDCHFKYDNKGWSYAQTMKSYQLLLDRLSKFIGELTEKEISRLPEQYQHTQWRRKK